MASRNQAESRPQSQSTQTHGIHEFGHRNPEANPPKPSEQRHPDEHSAIPICATNRPELTPSVGSLLVGKPINQDGDIVNQETGEVLARAAGDLPSMAGRHVSNVQGDVLGEDGELLGYVADIIQTPGRPRSLFDAMGHASTSLMVDPMGNILDSTGTVVGKFHDNNNPLHRDGRREQGIGEQPESSTRPSRPTAANQALPSPHQQSRSCSPTPARRTEEERRENAEDWRKENPADSPSDIFLDVKSTREGIQLTIRIPTVFPGQATPHISFS